jgi:hypothetical protein
MPDELIPLFAIFFIFGAPVTAWIISRVLAHQERIEMIRNGYVPPPDPRAMRNAARYGAWQSGPIPPPPVGGPIPPSVRSYSDGCNPQAQLRKGITVSLVGFALLIGLSLFGYMGGGEFHYGPWLLGGLIPLFVGIAQIINAVLNGATIPGVGTQAGTASFGPRPMNQGTPQPPPSAPQQEPPYAGPYGWRPDSTPEIGKPVQPPDPR